MAKFFKMVHNEFIKIFAKVSTKIFLLFILLMVILFNIMMRIQVNYAVSLGGQNNKEELQSLRDSDIINDKIYLEEKEFIIDNELDKSDQSTSWRETRVGAIFAQKMEFIDNNKLVLPESLKKHHDKQLELIKNNDAKAYCDYMISWVKSNNDMTQKDKDSEIWMYEFITKNNIYTPDETADGTWKSELFGNVLSQKTIYENLKENNNAGNEEDAKAFADAEKGYLTGIYRIENNVKYVYQGNSSDFFDTKNAYWSVIGNSISLISIISLIVIIVAGAMISSEFSGGTIKFLLINPISRGKILMSKYFCLISVSYIFIAAFFVFNVIVSGCFFGFGQLNAVSLTVSNGTVVQMPALIKLASEYAIASVSTVVYGTFAFMMSTLFKNSAFAIGIGVFSVTMGSTIVVMLKHAFSQDWARYILFANTDLTAVINGTTGFSGHTLSFALINIAVYMVVFLLIAWDAFTRRDVK